MLYNLLAFTIIFILFSVIISSIMKSSLFSQADTELMIFQERLEREVQIRQDGPRNDHVAPWSDIRFNPRIMMLVWNEDGEIINQEQLGTNLYENYFRDYEFNERSLNTITSIQIDELYHFRTLLFESNIGYDEKLYIQLLINVDPEQSVFKRFNMILAICSLLFIILSISASHLLAKRMMKPIILSWSRQADFVENASHELRTPLTIIQNKLELLLTTPHAKVMDKFENIALSLSETRRLAKLTDDMLTLARADSLETLLVKETVYVDDFIRNVCLPYMEIADLQNKYLTLDLRSGAVIQADKNRMHQLLVILIDNALKYSTEQDAICVKTIVAEQRLCIEVSDTGIGISEENRETIFERFYREDKARTREKGGTGLGLTIAQWIVTSHKGTIHVRSNSPKGTVFIINIPIA